MRTIARAVLTAGAAAALAIPSSRVGASPDPQPASPQHSVLQPSGPRVLHANGVTSPPGYGVATFTGSTATRTKPDDITVLNGQVAVSFQNGVGPKGEPGSLGGASTVAMFNSAGTLTQSWSLTGRCDGLTADAANGRLLATVNEDANTGFYVLRPGAAPRKLTINDPNGAITGGLDSIAIRNGFIDVSTSNPTDSTKTVLASVVIDETAGTLTVTSALTGNAAATDGNSNDSPPLTAINVADPDSNGQVPASAAAFAGQLYLVGEGDHQVVFINPPATASTVTVVQVGTGLGDLAWPTSQVGTLYVTDNGTGRVYAISSSSWTPGKPLAASPIKSDSNAQTGGFVGALDLATGNLQPVISGLQTPVGLAFVPGPAPQGYWEVASDGGIFPFGNAGGFGSTGNIRLNQPVIGMAGTADGGGYWLAASDGGIFPFGNAVGYGSTGNIRLNRPVVGMAATPRGDGYWLVASDGGVFPFGAAVGYGSLGSVRLNRPIVGMAATADGGGYWLVAADGGVFPFGDAAGYGSMGGTAIPAPITGMAALPDGAGYWLVGTDGSVYPFGSARQLGGTGTMRLSQPIAGIASTRTGRGYWLTAADGGIFPFGDAQGLGSEGGVRLNRPVVGIAATA